MTPSLRLSRREALAAGLGGIAVAALPGLTDDAFAAPIIDTHQHLWDLRRLKLPWLANNKTLNRNYLTADYVTAAEGLNVEQAVYMEVAVVPEQRVDEGRWVQALLDQRSSPTKAAVLGGEIGDDKFRNYVRDFKDDSRIKGVRCTLPSEPASHATVVANLQYLGEIGWRFDLAPDPTGLADVAKLAAACPETRFVLDHCGNASTAFYAKREASDARGKWEEGLAILADQRNVICKISGVCEAGLRELATLEHATPVVNRCLDRFGAERVVFSGNWPVCLIAQPLKAWVEMLRAIAAPRGDGFTRKLFCDNARRFYGLK